MSMTQNERHRRSKPKVIGWVAASLAVTAVITWLVVGWIESRDQAEIMDVNFVSPNTVHLMVASCNGAPEATVYETDGRLEIKVEATQDWDRGDECADAVTIQVEEGFGVLEIRDRTSGREFTISSEG